LKMEDQVSSSDASHLSHLSDWSFLSSKSKPPYTEEVSDLPISSPIKLWITFQLSKIWYKLIHLL
jgi:hypothetical protein